MAESRFLRSLTPEVLHVMGPDLQTIQLEKNFIIMRIGEPLEYVYFPTDCLISVIVVMANGNTIEATTIGNDGFVGESAFLGTELSNVTGMVQISGETQRMNISAFHHHLQDPQLRQSVGSFAARKFGLVAQSAACIAFHPIHARLARWLLQVRDGMERSEFALTQDFLSMMLGVHRPTVTVAFRSLEDAGLVDHRRGKIRIIDGDALEEAACECYAVSRPPAPMPS